MSAPDHRRAQSAAIDRMMAGVRREPPLSREAQLSLARKFRLGDERAGQSLARCNLRLVLQIARRLGGQMPEHLLDLVQEGNEGLVQAVRHFDPERGVAFTTYAAWWIRAYVFRYLLLNWRLVRVGTTREHRQIFFNLSRERRRLEARGESADPARLARELGTSEQAILELGRHLSTPEAGEDAAEAVAAPDELRPDRLVEHAQLRRALQKILTDFERELEPREQLVLRERWRTAEPHTLRDCGEKLGLTGERVRQLEHGMLERLQLKARNLLEPELQTA